MSEARRLRALEDGMPRGFCMLRVRVARIDRKLSTVIAPELVDRLSLLISETSPTTARRAILSSLNALVKIDHLAAEQARMM